MEAEADDGGSGLPEGSGTPPVSAGSAVTADGSTAGGSLAAEGWPHPHQFPGQPGACSASLATSDTTAADMESHDAGSVELGIDNVRLGWNKRVSLVDRKQAELFDAQWQFLRDQMSSFSNEIVSMNDELRCLLQRAVQVEVRDCINAWRRGSDAPAEMAGELKQQVPEASPQIDPHQSLTELRAALVAEVSQRKDGETRLMGRFHDCLRIAEEAASGQASLAEQVKVLRSDLRSGLSSQATSCGERYVELEQQIKLLRESSATSCGERYAELEQQIKSLQENSTQESLRHRDNHKQALDALQKVQRMVASIKGECADDVQRPSSRNSTVLENEVRALRDEMAQQERAAFGVHSTTTDVPHHHAEEQMAHEPQVIEQRECDAQLVQAFLQGGWSLGASFERAYGVHDEFASRERWEENCDYNKVEHALQGLFDSVGALQETTRREAESRANDTEELRQHLCSEMGSFRDHTMSQLEAELKRLWEAFETHTHDVRVDVSDKLDSGKYKTCRTQARHKSPHGHQVKRS